MRRKFFLFLLICVSLIFSSTASNYGLYFNSHSTPSAQRTSLRLNAGKAFEIGNDFTMNFFLDIRKEPIFGNIFCIQMNDGQTVNAIFSIKNNDLYYPALVINENIYPIDIPAKEMENIEVTFSISKDKNAVIFNFHGKAIDVPMNLTTADKLSITFGKHQRQKDHPDVAPINIRDIRIFQNEKESYHWELKQHNDSVCYDIQQQALAIATCPHWILNDHVEWKDIYSMNSKEKIQIAFNPEKNIFYIAQENKINCFYPATNKNISIPINHGYRAMMYSNYLEYNPLTQKLLSYNLAERISSQFDFQTQSWNLKSANISEPTYSNHTWATTDTIAYTFGGYGFYHYNNNLFQINLKNGQITEIENKPNIPPRCTAASAIVGNKLYIFGGLGNSSGKQELPSQYYYDLHVINLEDMTSQKVWETDKVENNFLLAPEMFFNAEDSSFYAASTEYGGMLIKIFINKPHWEYISTPIKKHLIFKDFTFNLYHAPLYRKMYMVINKRMNDLHHEIEIYSIDLPLFENNQINQTTSSEQNNSRLWIILPVLCISTIVALFLLLRSKKKKIPLADKARLEDKQDEYITIPSVPVFTPTEHFNRKKSAVSFLGEFNVRDKEGNDITSLFTPRTKSLLIILFLYSEKYEKGILMKKLDEYIWNDKDEESARNNRNVYMRKLRVLLEKIGNIEIPNDKLFYKVKFGPEVFFDYHESIVHMGHIKNEGIEDQQLIEKTLELLLYGPLLPDTTYEWLDPFKADYSSSAISFLTTWLLNELKRKNESLAFNIAETIFLHDTLNEEALAAQCIILCNRKTTGLAKNVYENFCKEYYRCMNETYPKSFHEICNNFNNDKQTDKIT